MPNWLSRDGVWYPVKEKVGLKKKDGEPYIYEGPDRAALFVLFQEKTETLGMDFRHDPDLLARVRALGYKDIDEYALAVGYDPQKVEEDFQKHASAVNKHELPEKVKAVEMMGGGVDTSGQGNDIPGGFGKPKDL